MIHAYQEIYLSKAQSVLGDAFDYGVNTCAIPGADFVKLFLASTISRRMENGEPACLAGKSGIELVREIMAETMGREPQQEPQVHFDRSREYWIGWAVAYYQWYSGKGYRDIFMALPFDELERMYEPLHQADITKFVEIADARIKAYFCETNLKRIRSACGFSQAELARRSSVSLRSIQMYEQRNKNINRASAEIIYRLAKALGCGMEELVEK